MTSESKVCRIYEDAHVLRRGKFWRVYPERESRGSIGSGVTKQAAWDRAWKNVPADDKRSALAWRRIDKLRAALSDDGWLEIYSVMDMRMSIYVFEKNGERQILTIDCYAGAEKIRRFAESSKGSTEGEK